MAVLAKAGWVVRSVGLTWPMRNVLRPNITPTSAIPNKTNMTGVHKYIFPHGQFAKPCSRASISRSIRLDAEVNRARSE